MSMFCRQRVKNSNTKILIRTLFFKRESFFTIKPLDFYMSIIIFCPWCRKAGVFMLGIRYLGLSGFLYIFHLACDILFGDEE